MKLLKSIGKWILFAFIALNVLTLLSGNKFIYKAVYYNLVNIDDCKIFANRNIAKSANPKPWMVSGNTYNKTTFSPSLLNTLTGLKSVAFLVIRNDTILNEAYWEGYSDTSVSNSFSMAKSAVSLLIGAAIKDGYIKSVNQPVADFLPEFKVGAKANITIKHLLQMSSGLDFDEGSSYTNPFSIIVSDILVAYYDDKLYNTVASKLAVEKPGKYFDYKSGDTQLLAFILMKATGKKMSEYFYEKIWNNIGAEQPAFWSLDKEDGYEKAFCCLNSNARDFAKLGKLYMTSGYANGTQVIDTNYIEASKTASSLYNKKDTSKIADFYGYQLWLMNQYKGQNIYYLRGTLGQLVICIPEKNIIIVRLGMKQGARFEEHYSQSYTIIDEVNAMY